MKKIMQLIIIMLLVLIISIPISVKAQSTATSAPGSWESTLTIFNNGSESAVVTLTFYDSSGNEIDSHTISPEIGAGETLYLYASDFTAIPNGQFSMVVSSSQPITTVASQTSKSPRTAGAYTGFSQDDASLDLYFPGLYKSYYTFNSEIVLQNTSQTDIANISINFYNQFTGSFVESVTETIPANATRVFYLHDLPGVPEGKVNGLLSAYVSSDQPLVGITDIWSSRVAGLFSNYNSFSQGSTNVLYAPALYNYYYNFVSALTVQNIDSSQNAIIRITYSNGIVKTTTLGPNQSKEYYQPNDSSLPKGNSKGYFSAKVESTNGVPIVALVNVEDKEKGLLASYNTSISSATSLNCPLVYKNYFNWFSAETVQNVGSKPTNITIHYSIGNGAYDRTFTSIPPNGTINIIELSNAGSKLPDGSAVSAMISSSGEPIISVVQLNNEIAYPSAPGDYLEAYTCSPINID